MKKMSAILGVLVIAAALTLSGCGKNVVGPTAPEVIVPASSLNGSAPDLVEQLNTGDDQVSADIGEADDVNASCHATVPNKKHNYNSLKYKHKSKRYVRKHIKRWLMRFYSRLRGQWYFSPPFREPIRHLLFSNKLFAFIVLRHRIDQKIATTAMEIIAHAYQSGNNTNPGNFDPEVTLLPYKWKGYCNGGFDNQLLPGWKIIPNSSDGYVFETNNENNDLVGIDTKSYQVDVYKNNADIKRYRWVYTHDPVDADFYKIEFEMQNQEAFNRLRLDARLIDLDGTQTIVELWRSTIDDNFAGYFRIRKTDGTLDLNLAFDAIGDGGGTLDILNRHGKMDHYEYVFLMEGQSYWTKNGGKKHKF